VAAELGGTVKKRVGEETRKKNKVEEHKVRSG
jgi:hypothetical protein